MKPTPPSTAVNPRGWFGALAAIIGKPGNLFFTVIFIPLTILFVSEAALSLKWRMMHDTPIMLYITFLIDKLGYVPYRDIFDMNAPGAYGVMLMVCKIFGYGDFGMRLADLSCLCLLLAITWVLIKRFNRKAAWSSIVIFGLGYLAWGSPISLQREYFVLILVALASLFAFSSKRQLARALLVGLLIGLATTIKPLAVLSLPCFLVFLFTAPEEKSETKKAAWRALLITLAGFIVPPLLVVLCLQRLGALSSFWRIARNYWPLYAAMTAKHVPVFGMERLTYMVRGYFDFSTHSLWLPAAMFGIYLGLCQARLPKQRKRELCLLAALAGVFSIYPVLANQFFYHWLPFFYFIAILSSLCLLEVPDAIGFKRLFPLLVLLFGMAGSIQLSDEYCAQVQHKPMAEPEDGRADKLASFLKFELQPGDKVQPLDWTGGVVHAMLMTKAEIATPFIYDFHFYHHITTPYILELRKIFMERLSLAAPRFIIATSIGRTWMFGGGTVTSKFPELQNLLDKQYKITQQGKTLTVYERLSDQTNMNGNP